VNVDNVVMTLKHKLGLTGRGFQLYFIYLACCVVSEMSSVNKPSETFKYNVKNCIVFRGKRGLKIDFKV